MNEQERIIKLINEIDKIVQDEFFEDTLILENDEDLLNNFSDKLLEIFDDGLNENILNMISKLEYKNIFKIHVGDKYINNTIRKEIEEYLDDNEELYLDFNLIKQNIKENYKLAKYLKEKDKILELLDLNEKVLLFIEAKYATKELILNQMKKSNFVSLTFLGKYGKDNSIYRYSKFYSDNEEINDLLYEQLKVELTNDVTQYIHASEIVKSNNKINELVIGIDSRMEAYIKDSVN